MGYIWAAAMTFFCPLGMVGRDIGWSGMVTWLQHNPLWLGYMWGGILLSKPFVASRIIESSLTWMFISVKQHTNGGLNKENDRETTRKGGAVTSSDSQGWIGRSFWTTTALARRIKSDWTQGKLFFQQHLQAKVRFHSHRGVHFGSLSDWESSAVPCCVAERFWGAKLPLVDASGRWVTMGHDGSRLPWYGIPTIHSKTKSMKFPQKKKHKKTSKTQRHN